MVSDERILGSGEFIEGLLSAEGEGEADSGVEGRVPDLPTLLSKISKKEGVEEEKVRRGSEAIGGECTESILQAGVKRMDILGQRLRVFGCNHFAGQSVASF